MITFCTKYFIMNCMALAIILNNKNLRQDDTGLQLQERVGGKLQTMVWYENSLFTLYGYTYSLKINYFLTESKVTN